ncbi:DUF6226 family protein [Corynebacterium sp.]|uniref:DUF6226 family protein n=1 Tax=Corynebacterium sp. TaxID=1720 RepID=UPI0026DED216|nr:DUF6226 family protein [Corynebacterium sp.]MDO5512343.1 DUF6226 family protein [Corynebacterium sp.]
MTRWWQDLHDPLTHQATMLLDAVEAAHRAQDPPSWPAPDDEPNDEDYSACADPGRFRMIIDRALAWARVLEERGWAEVTRERMDEEDWRITLRPRAGALPLRLQGAAWIFHNGRAPMVEVLVGEPAHAESDHPDCACDACDRGSAAIIESLDQDIFSVVDGSYRVIRKDGMRWTETSFRAGGTQTKETVREVHGVSWAPDWESRTPFSAAHQDLPPWPPPGFDDLPDDWPADGRYRQLPE